MKIQQIFSRQEVSFLSGVDYRILQKLEKDRVIKPQYRSPLGYSWYNLLSACIYYWISIQNNYEDMAIKSCLNFYDYVQINGNYLGKNQVLSFKSTYPHEINLFELPHKDSNIIFRVLMGEAMNHDLCRVSLIEKGKVEVEWNESYCYFYLKNLYQYLINLSSDNISLQKKIHYIIS